MSDRGVRPVRRRNSRTAATTAKKGGADEDVDDVFTG